LISKALNDFHISTEEFTLIMKEKEQFITMKNSIRNKQRESSSGVDVEQLKNTYFRRRKEIGSIRNDRKVTSEINNKEKIKVNNKEKTKMYNIYNYYYYWPSPQFHDYGAQNVLPSAPPDYC
jgi:hypothetical protein